MRSILAAIYRVFWKATRKSHSFFRLSPNVFLEKDKIFCAHNIVFLVLFFEDVCQEGATREEVKRNIEPKNNSTIEQVL